MLIRRQTVTVEVPTKEGNVFDKQEVEDVKEKWLYMLSSLNVCSQKGLVEMFDSSIGRKQCIHAIWR